jgi:predicted nuclease of predicted toxin-antitoxin system
MTHLRLICDQMVPASIVEWLREGPGRHKVITAHEKGWDALSDDALIRRATGENRILVTMDKEFQSSHLYRICTHAGILVIRCQGQTRDECIEIVKKFLLSGHRSRCKHAIATLSTGSVRIEDGDGVEDLPL